MSECKRCDALVEALEQSEIDVSLERTWCRMCRTEDRSRTRNRSQHPHAASCVLAAHRSGAPGHCPAGTACSRCGGSGMHDARHSDRFCAHCNGSGTEPPAPSAQPSGADGELRAKCEELIGYEQRWRNGDVSVTALAVCASNLAPDLARALLARLDAPEADAEGGEPT